MLAAQHVSQDTLKSVCKTYEDGITLLPLITDACLLSPCRPYRLCGLDSAALHIQDALECHLQSGHPVLDCAQALEDVGLHGMGQPLFTWSILCSQDQ